MKRSDWGARERHRLRRSGFNRHRLGKGDFSRVDLPFQGPLYIGRREILQVRLNRDIRTPRAKFFRSDPWIDESDILGGPQINVFVDTHIEPRDRGHPIPATRADKGGAAVVFFGDKYRTLAGFLFVRDLCSHLGIVLAKQHRDIIKNRQGIFSANLDQAGDVEASALKESVHGADLTAIHIDIGIPVDGVEIQPYPAALIGLGNREVGAIPKITVILKDIDLIDIIPEVGILLFAGQDIGAENGSRDLSRQPTCCGETSR